MDLHVSLSGDQPLGRQIYEQIRAAIVEGRLAAGERLPPTRVLAQRLAVARNTVVFAYDLLAAEGFIAGRVGAGSVVLAGARPSERRRAPPGPLAARPLWGRLQLPNLAAPAQFDFRAGYPDPALFPADTWRRLVARELRLQSSARLGARDPLGDHRVRAAIARHAAVSRSIDCAADDVVLTAGAQQGFDLIARCLLEPGDTVVMEEPGYPMARLAFEAQGARIVGATVDDEGLAPETLPARARLVFVTPSHQFPTGVPMSLRRRHSLLEWAAQAGAAVVEDDYNGEFRFDGRPLEPLQRLDRQGRVIFVGTFSKVLHPDLRLGYLVSPPSLREAFATAKWLADLHTPYELQGALAALIETGELATHVRRLRTVYGDRRARLRAALARHLPQARIMPSVAGLHLGVRLPQLDASSTHVAAAAHAAGVACSPWSDFAAGDVPRGLALGFGQIQAHAIEPGVARLAEALRPLA